MINNIAITNFQSWRAGSLYFAPGINAIIGESDNGKSAILRGLYWLIENSPGGGSFCSFWNKDDKGKQREEISILIEKDGTLIQRAKTQEQNGYMLGGDIFEAIGRDVPQQVQTALNLGPVNIAKQLDAPFLISGSAGEVARFFNEIIKLDEIDNCLTAADSLKRETNAAIKEKELQQLQLETSLKKYTFLEKAVLQAGKCTNIEERLNEAAKQCQTAGDLLEAGQTAAAELQKYEFLDAAEQLIKKADKTQADLRIVENNNRQYESFFITYGSVQTALKSLPDLGAISVQAAAAKKTGDALQTAIEKQQSFVDLLNLSRGLAAEIDATSITLQRLEESMPAVCPLCGGKV